VWTVAVDQYYGDVSLALKVNTTLNAMWWMLNDTASHAPQDTHKLWMTSFNQRIAPSSVLSMATNYGSVFITSMLSFIMWNSLYYLILIRPRHWSIASSMTYCCRPDHVAIRSAMPVSELTAMNICSDNMKSFFYVILLSALLDSYEMWQLDSFGETSYLMLYCMP